MIRLILASLALLAGCVQPPSFPAAGDPGPVSLQLVPPDYYSRTLRPGPAGGATRTKPARATQQTSSEENEALTPPPAPPEEISDLLKRLEALDGRMQELQKKLSRSPRPRRQSVPLSFEPIEP